MGKLLAAKYSMKAVVLRSLSVDPDTNEPEYVQDESGNIIIEWDDVVDDDGDNIREPLEIKCRVHPGIKGTRMSVAEEWAERFREEEMATLVSAVRVLKSDRVTNIRDKHGVLFWQAVDGSAPVFDVVGAESILNPVSGIAEFRTIMRRVQ